MEDTTTPSTQVSPQMTQSAPPPQSMVQQDANPSPQPTEPTPPQSPTPTKKLLPKIILGIILIVALGISSVIVLNKKNSTLPKNTQTTSKNTVTDSKPKPQQPGLTTYTNNTGKFSLQYPQDLQVKEKTVGMGVSTVELRNEENLNEEYLADVQMMSIPKYLAKAIGQDFDEYYNMSENTSKTISADEQSRVITKVKNRSINNLRAFEFRSTDGSSNDAAATIGVYIETGDKIVIISTQEENREDLENMLVNFTYNP